MRVAVLAGLLTVGCAGINLPTLNPGTKTEMPTHAMCARAGYEVSLILHGPFMLSEEDLNIVVQAWNLCLIKYPSHWVDRETLDNPPALGGSE